MQSEYFVGSRGGDKTNVSFKQAILSPIAPYGGLWTLKKIPFFSREQRECFADLEYSALTKEIFASLGLEIEDEVLQKALNLYKKFDNESIPAPLHKVNETLTIQKLYCGPTRAFKDMALQPFGYIFDSFVSDSAKEYLILVATSGDTGPATLESFAGSQKVRVVCLYPKGGTSNIQRLQMTTMQAKNLKVIGIDGDFDDAQNLLKEFLGDSSFNQTLLQKNISLSAANSVNFGRIAFQIPYHIYASLQSFKQNQKDVHIIIPSGNFGNALGAFYAKIMGFPIAKIWIASNANSILSDFIQTGVYDISHRILQKTCSPAMDILKSSNIERVLFVLFGAERTNSLMRDLQKYKKYTLTPQELEQLQLHFGATFCDDSYCLEKIREYASLGVIIDPHTACGIKAYETIMQFYQNASCILCSTAEWTKFASTLSRALGFGELSEQESLQKISEKYNLEVPRSILQLFTKDEVHNQCIAKDEVLQNILAWL